MTKRQQARQLRSNQTDTEQHLWYHLRAHRLQGLKFKRQVPIGPYIVDFVCLHAGVIVEVDGGQHADDATYDGKRDDFLTKRGFTVLRFWNDEVLKQTEAVLARIADATGALSPDLSPESRREERASQGSNP